MEHRLEAPIEAILFALGKSVETVRLAEVLETDPVDVTAACLHLQERYERTGAGIRLVRIEESWQLCSAPRYGELVRKLLTRKRPDKLSPAALETLAVVAYFQPVTRVYIDQVRGVDSAHSLSLLMDRELVAPCGSLDAPGRPNLYRTTEEFLRVFGLASLEELPPLPEALAKEAEGGGAM